MKWQLCLYLKGGSDIGDIVMPVLDVGDRISVLVALFECWCPKLILELMIVNVADQNARNRHQHLIVVINSFRLQHPSLTSMSP